MRGNDHMSASSKKKLRKEQAAAQMTEKQLAEQKEAKKLKLYTTAFVVMVAIVLVIAIAVGMHAIYIVAADVYALGLCRAEAAQPVAVKAV